MITSLVTVIINYYDHIKAWKGGGIPNLNLTHPSTYTIAQALPLVLTFRLHMGELRNKANSVICTDTTHTLPHSVICTVILHIHYPTL